MAARHRHPGGFAPERTNRPAVPVNSSVRPYARIMSPPVPRLHILAGWPHDDHDPSQPGQDQGSAGRTVGEAQSRGGG